MGLFRRFFGKPAPARASPALTTDRLPRDPTADPARLDLLVHFAWRKADALDLDPDWTQRLGEPPRSTLQRLVLAGLLRPLSTEGRLDRLLTVAELKGHLKAHGLSNSGSKPSLIDLLVGQASVHAESLASAVDAFGLTPQGQALVDERLACIANDRDAAVDQTAVMIRAMDYPAALRRKGVFEASYKAQPRIGAHLRQFGSAMSIPDRRDQSMVLKRTAEARPRYLGRHSEETWEELRFAVAMDFLWGGGLAQWTRSNADSLDGRDWMIVRSAIHKRATDIEARTRAHAAGITLMTFGCCSGACDPCWAQSKLAWPVVDAPELPHALCISPRGCLCIARPILPSARAEK